MGGAAAGASSTNLVCVWGLVEVLQIIHFIVYISITVPLVLREFFRILSFANMGMFPNVMEIFVIDTEAPPPPRFVEEEASSNFLLGIGDVGTAIIILAAT